jgi:CO dehydrogenase nickel-insertion accessory protein CooC1
VWKGRGISQRSAVKTGSAAEQSAGDFYVCTGHPSDNAMRRTLVATGRLTSGAGELLFCAVSTLITAGIKHIEVDVSAVTVLDIGGLEWLASSRRVVQAMEATLTVVGGPVGVRS